VIRLISATGKIHSKKTAAVIVVTTICGGLAFALIEPTKYALVAAGIAWLASVATTLFMDS